MPLTVKYSLLLTNISIPRHSNTPKRYHYLPQTNTYWSMPTLHQLHYMVEKISWIRALIHRAHKICSNDEILKAELSNIASFMSWNGYKKTVNIIQTPQPHNPCDTVTDNSIIEPSTIKIWIHLPFLGKYGSKLTYSFIRKK